MPARLLGIHGLKGSGKNSVVSILGRYMPPFREFSFGDKLKRIASETFEVPLEMFHRVDLKEVVMPEVGKSPREMLTSLADALKWKYGDDFFARGLAPRWRDAKAAGKDLVVVDVRHKEEREALRACNGVLLHVVRPSGAPYALSPHISERGLEVGQGDYTIMNIGDKLDLVHLTRSFILQWRGPASLDPYPYVPTDTSNLWF